MSGQAGTGTAVLEPAVRAWLARELPGQPVVAATLLGGGLRFSGRYPARFAGGFIAGYQEAGGPLPPGWREISEALDLYALAELLTRLPGIPTSARRVPDQEAAGARLPGA